MTEIRVPFPHSWTDSLLEQKMKHKDSLSELSSKPASFQCDQNANMSDSSQVPRELNTKSILFDELTKSAQITKGPGFVSKNLDPMTKEDDTNRDDKNKLDKMLMSNIQDADGFLHCPFCNQKFEKLKEVTQHYFMTHMGDKSYWNQHLQLGLDVAKDYQLKPLRDKCVESSTQLDLKQLTDYVVDVEGKSTSLLDLAMNIDQLDGDILVPDALSDLESCAKDGDGTEHITPVSMATTFALKSSFVNGHLEPGNVPTVSTSHALNPNTASANTEDDQRQIPSSVDDIKLEISSTDQALHISPTSTCSDGNLPIITKVESLATNQYKHDAKIQPPPANGDGLKQTNDKKSILNVANSNQIAKSSNQTGASYTGPCPVNRVPHGHLHPRERRSGSWTTSALVTKVYLSNAKRNTTHWCPLANMDYKYEPSPTELVVLEEMKSRNSSFCPYCLDKLGSISEAVEHVALHTKKAPYVCKCQSNCSFRTCYFDILQRHIIMHHSKTCSPAVHANLEAIPNFSVDYSQRVFLPEQLPIFSQTQNTPVMSGTTCRESQPNQTSSNTSRESHSWPNQQLISTPATNRTTSCEIQPNQQLTRTPETSTRTISRESLPNQQLIKTPETDSTTSHESLLNQQLIRTPETDYTTSRKSLPNQQLIRTYHITSCESQPNQPLIRPMLVPLYAFPGPYNPYQNMVQPPQQLFPPMGHITSQPNHPSPIACSTALHSSNGGDQTSPTINKPDQPTPPSMPHTFRHFRLNSGNHSPKRKKRTMHSNNVTCGDQTSPTINKSDQPAPSSMPHIFRHVRLNSGNHSPKRKKRTNKDNHKNHGNHDNQSATTLGQVLSSTLAPVSTDMTSHNDKIQVSSQETTSLLNSKLTSIYTSGCQPVRNQSGCQPVRNQPISTNHFHGNRHATCDIMNGNPLVASLLESSTHQLYKDANKSKDDVEDAELSNHVVNQDADDKQQQSSHDNHTSAPREISGTSSNRMSSTPPSLTLAPHCGHERPYLPTKSPINTNLGSPDEPTPDSVCSDPNSFQSRPDTVCSDRSAFESGPGAVCSDCSAFQSKPGTVCSDRSAFESRPDSLCSDRNAFASLAQMISEVTDPVPDEKAITTNKLTMVDADGQVSNVELVSAKYEERFVERLHHGKRKRRTDKTGCEKRKRLVSSRVSLVDDDGGVTSVELISSDCDSSDLKKKRKFVKLLGKMHKHWRKQFNTSSAVRTGVSIMNDDGHVSDKTCMNRENEGTHEIMNPSLKVGSDDQKYPMLINNNTMEVPNSAVFKEVMPVITHVVSLNST
ncbi:uncharacterized protein [Amphiura filiformis]|uniref:uncharacterized protein n=1 Tax=Amphiura filiformis TaxID=82378 RepID=UPI003B20F2C3